MSRLLLKTCRSLTTTPLRQQVTQPLPFRAVVQAFTRPYNTSQQLRDYPKEGVFQKNSPPRTKPVDRAAWPDAFPRHAQASAGPGEPSGPAYNNQESVFQQPSYEQGRPRTASSKNLHRALTSVYVAVVILAGFGAVLTAGMSLIALPFEPGSAEDREALDALNEELDSLPIVRDLRTLCVASETTGRPVLAFKEYPAYRAFSDPTSPIASQQRRENTFSTGPLKGSRGLGAQKVFMGHDGDGEIVVLINFGEATCGWPGTVHGGAISTVIDETMGRLAARFTTEKTTVTAKLAIDYRAPCRPGEWYAVHAKIIPQSIFPDHPDDFPDPHGQVKLASERMVIEVSREQAARRLAERRAAADKSEPADDASAAAAPPKTSKVLMMTSMFCVDETGPELPRQSARGPIPHYHAEATGLFVTPKGIELPPMEHRIGSLQY